MAATPPLTTSSPRFFPVLFLHTTFHYFLPPIYSPVLHASFSIVLLFFLSPSTTFQIPFNLSFFPPTFSFVCPPLCYPSKTIHGSLVSTILTTFRFSCLLASRLPLSFLQTYSFLCPPVFYPFLFFKSPSWFFAVH